MKRMCIAAFVVLALSACTTVRPDAGTEAVLVEKPMFFGHGGIDPEPVKTGLSYAAFSTWPDYVEMKPQQVGVEFDDLMTSDGVPLDFHANVQFRITDSVKLVRDFGNDSVANGSNQPVPGFFWRNVQKPFESAVRDAVKAHGLNEMAINASAADDVDKKVTAALQDIIKTTGVPMQLIGVTLGRANPPDAIKHQRIATAEQEQRIQTEKQGKLAEDQRKEREESRAAADRAYNVKMDLSPAQYLQLETIKMQRDVCSKGGCYFGFQPTWTQSAK